MKTLQRGFTLIELLVVIAIIGILSSIVLASLSSARTKGEDAAIQSTLSNMRAQAELYYANNNKYGVNSAAVTSPDNSCDAAGLSTTMFAVAATNPGSLLTLLTDLKSKATTAKTACGVNPATSAADVTAWAVAAQLKTGGATGNFWCVDSTGVSKSVTYVTTTLDTPEEAINSSAACN